MTREIGRRQRFVFLREDNDVCLFHATGKWHSFRKTSKTLLTLRKILLFNFLIKKYEIWSGPDDRLFGNSEISIVCVSVNIIKAREVDLRRARKKV